MILRRRVWAIYMSNVPWRTNRRKKKKAHQVHGVVTCRYVMMMMKKKFFFVFFSSKIKQKRPIWKYKKKKCYFFLSCWKLKVDIRTYQRQNGKERRRSKKDENLLAEGNRLRVLSSCILEGKYIIHGAIVLLLLLLFAHTDARTWI